MASTIPRYIGAPEFARVLGVGADTVRDWCADGRLPGAIRFGRLGAWRIPVSLLESDDGPVVTGPHVESLDRGEGNGSP
jgi:excisionase family DNA binding protein